MQQRTALLSIAVGAALLGGAVSNCAPSARGPLSPDWEAALLGRGQPLAAASDDAIGSSYIRSAVRPDAAGMARLQYGQVIDVNLPSQYKWDPSMISIPMTGAGDFRELYRDAVTKYIHEALSRDGTEAGEMSPVGNYVAQIPGTHDFLRHDGGHTIEDPFLPSPWRYYEKSWITDRVLHDAFSSQVLTASMEGQVILHGNVKTDWTTSFEIPVIVNGVTLGAIEFHPPVESGLHATGTFKGTISGTLSGARLVVYVVRETTHWEYAKLELQRRTFQRVDAAGTAIGPIKREHDFSHTWRKYDETCMLVDVYIVHELLPVGDLELHRRYWQAAREHIDAVRRNEDTRQHPQPGDAAAFFDGVE